MADAAIFHRQHGNQGRVFHVRDGLPGESMILSAFKSFSKDC